MAVPEGLDYTIERCKHKQQGLDYTIERCKHKHRKEWFENVTRQEQLDRIFIAQKKAREQVKHALCHKGSTLFGCAIKEKENQRELANKGRKLFAFSGGVD